MEANDLRHVIRDVPDFPKPGILFKDITPVLENPAAYAAAGASSRLMTTAIMASGRVTQRFRWPRGSHAPPPRGRRRARGS